MTAIISLFIVLTLSFLATRLATVALSLTGVSYELARFQAVSAFTGVGFTTRESEHVTSHPVRRRILILLMIFGNAGIVTAVSSLVLSLTGIRQAERGLWLAALLVAGPVLLWFVARSRWIERYLGRALRFALDRWTDLEALDYASLLQLTGSYSVRELEVHSGDWIEGKPLSESELHEEGITVLGIHRESGDYVGVPRGETKVCAGDRLILYGTEEDIGELSVRRHGPGGDAEHREAIEEQSVRRARQAETDE